MTSTTPDQLYGITVSIYTGDLDSGALRWVDWNGAHHHGIEVSSAVDPKSKDQYDREELFAAFRWCTGILGRLVAETDAAIKRESQRFGHRCADDPGRETCGFYGNHGIASPRWAVDGELYVPTVSFTVSNALTESWVAEFRRLIEEMLTEEMTPLDPLPPDPVHGLVQLNESTTSKTTTP